MQTKKTNFSLVVVVADTFSFFLSARLSLPHYRSLSLSLSLFHKAHIMSSSSPSQPPSSSGAKKGEPRGEIIESLAGLWSDKVCEDARALRSSFGQKAALDFLVEETKNVEQVVAGGVHEVRWEPKV